MPIVNEYGFRVPVKLIIVGNGFDIAIGAKTTYDAFYECLKKCSRSENFESFKKDYFYEGNEKLIDLFHQIVKKNQKNYFINYFLKYANAFGNWVSFEKELTKIIKAFDDLATFLNSPDRLIVYPSSGGCARVYVRVFDNTGLLQVLSVYPNNRFFSTDLKQYPREGVQYLSFKFKGKTFKDIYGFYNRAADFAHGVAKELFDDLTVFSNLFSLYLGIVDHYVKPGYRLKGVDQRSLFINYNFTNYLTAFVEGGESGFKKIININGLVDNSSAVPETNIVFGIDSDTQVSNHQFEVFTKRIQRSIKETDIKFLELMLSERITEIEVIGHSLNLADYESLNFIFSKTDVRKPKITVYYYDKESKSDLVINLEQILGKNVFDDYQRQGLLKFVNSKEAWEK